MKLVKRKTILVIFIALAIILSLNFFQPGVKGFFYSISSPIQQWFWKVGDSTASFFGGIFQGAELKKENEELYLKIQELMAENALLQELKSENEALREGLEIGLAGEFRLALADVTARDIGQDSLLIDQGSTDGLAEGMPVVTGQKVLLGRISEVFERFSRVILISNQDSSFDVNLSESGAAGVVRGEGGIKLYLDFVSQDETVAEGELVTTSALGGLYPKGFLVGSVEKIERSDVKPFYEIEVVSFFDLNALGSVFVILNF